MTDTPDDEFYRRAAAALERASEAAEDQVHATDNLAHEISAALEAIDDVLPNFPTRAEVDRRRRTTVVRMAFAGVWLVLAANLVNAQYVKACSPGARASRVADVLVDGRPTLERLRAESTRDLPAWCDSLDPLYAHDPAGEFPTPENVVGMALYAGFAVVTIAAVRPHRTKETPVD